MYPATPPAPLRSPPRSGELRPGWQWVENIHLPEPTYWPAVMALGIVFLAWGLITSLLISAVGLILFVLALAGWIGDIQHEQRH